MSTYNYAKQIIKPRVIFDSQKFISVEDIIGGKENIFQALIDENITFPVPFTKAETDLDSKDTVDEHQVDICMNPVHEHSKLYAKDISRDDLLTMLPFLDR